MKSEELPKERTITKSQLEFITEHGHPYYVHVPDIAVFLFKSLIDAYKQFKYETHEAYICALNHRVLKSKADSRVKYKGYTISALNPNSGKPWNPLSKYRFIHDEYDGDNDFRFGEGLTIDECKVKIDELAQ